MTTPLDQAHAAMEAAPGDDAARLRFFGLLADSDLILLLDGEAGETLTPRVFPLEDGPVVAVFDTDERLAAFAGGIAGYAALPGRVIAAQLAGQGVGLALNLGVAPSSVLLPAEAMDWLARTLAHAPEPVAGARPLGFRRPTLSPAARGALADRLARGAGLARQALLAEARYPDGRQGHVMAILGADPAAQPALARSLAEAMTFAGLEDAMLDVAFPDADDALVARMRPVAEVLDLPRPVAPPAATAPAAPGRDPDRPPKLR